MESDRRYVYLLNTAQKRLHRHLEQHAERHAGISVVQAGALFALVRQDGALSGELAATLDIAPSAMTGLADRMLRAGLIERRVDALDKRINRLWLTERGRAAATTAQHELAPLNRKLSEGFTEDEMHVVARWLSAVGQRFS
ncbi:MarR family winged helix-turn-helix transcriptional regulator [Pseudomonas fontis]|uniref:MarR family winged helix-turn-helix transcriptional regulator n=1 Tax=Pseudomonas fontis TaxID=2942633 RepID=A0ABT5NX15_9PSED|nr:MarR family winged helix-turn-helix transcriptional regulator [Pseudomonas fontis]MDD0975047.1 MarR family winged helix-turn-helix transcriptional regulator [Pseudomonas fontis]MDD0992732.1 MarR family winged helix-turn-helix transcriptional regulator [Pseudomonas fontis]